MIDEILTEIEDAISDEKLFPVVDRRLDDMIWLVERNLVGLQGLFLFEAFENNMSRVYVDCHDISILKKQNELMKSINGRIEEFFFLDRVRTVRIKMFWARLWFHLKYPDNSAVADGVSELIFSYRDVLQDT